MVTKLLKNKLSISTFIFNLAYIPWIMIYVINQTYYTDILPMEIISSIFRILIYCLLYIKFLFDESVSIKTILAFFIIIIVFIITLNSRMINIMDTFLFIYSARNLDLRKIIKVTLNLHITLMLSILLSAFIGIIKNDIWYRPDYSIRYGLGYKYTTFTANYFFHMVLMYIYLKGEKKINIIECIAIAAINYCIYYLTDTRAVYYLIVATIILTYIVGKIKNINTEKSSIKNLIYQYCIPILAVLTVIITIKYNPSNHLFKMIDEALTGRLTLSHSALETYGISLLGQNIEWVTGGSSLEINHLYNYVDSSYINILLNYGMIMLIFVCIGFSKVGKSAMLNNDKYLIIVLIVLGIHSVTDPQLIELGYNPFLLMISLLFASNNKENKRKIRVKF